MARVVNPMRARALGYLRDGAVLVIHARSEKDVLVPHEVVVQVTGHSGTYVVDLLDGAWTCTCRKGQDCAHIATAQLITGAPSAAAKDAEPAEALAGGAA